jgi:G:T-mismatch repair DNA endonuclease (very short patch repair protein)
MNLKTTLGGKMKPENYIELKFWIDEGIPKYSVRLKKVYTEKKPYPKGSNGMPLSTSKVEYFSYFLGEETADLVYKFVKPFFSKQYAFAYALKTGLIDEANRSTVESYFVSVESKMKQNHAIAVAKPEYREKLRKASNHELQSKLKKEWYKNEENRKKIVDAAQTPEAKQKRVAKYKKWINEGGREKLLLAANKPERKAKISERSKKMWEKAKISRDEEKLAAWYKGRFARNYRLQNYDVNKIEYEFGLLLLELDVQFVYEPTIPLEEGCVYPDFLVPKHNLIFECYGDFWHGNPCLYAPDKILYENVTALAIWLKDENRTASLMRQGYKVYPFWEADILGNKSAVKEKVKEILNEYK